nr:unnamed protein product [Callosobruchus analis]
MNNPPQNHQVLVFTRTLPPDGLSS